MNEYKLYYLDHKGWNVEVGAIIASSDEDAILKARTMTGLRQCEVWRGRHLVAKITDFLDSQASPHHASRSSSDASKTALDSGFSRAPGQPHYGS